jgi:hypothetical protein
MPPRVSAKFMILLESCDLIGCRIVNEFLAKLAIYDDDDKKKKKHHHDDDDAKKETLTFFTYVFESFI